MLDSLDDEMDGTSGFLGGSMNRVRLMMNSGRGNRKVMCYVTVGVVGAFFVLYLTMSKLLGGSSSSRVMASQP